MVRLATRSPWWHSPTFSPKPSLGSVARRAISGLRLGFRDQMSVSTLQGFSIAVGCLFVLGGPDPLLNHVVIGDGRHFAFTDQNVL
jgi:hypothetical protein